MNFGAHDLLEIRNNPKHRNWHAVGDALMLLSDGLKQYAEKKMKDFYALLLKKVGGVQCSCKCTLGMKRNPHEKATSCIWAQELKKHHVFKKKADIPWHQSDSNKWHDPVFGYWEIAKLFMSGIGSDPAKVTDPNSTDVGPLLNLFRFCKYFNVQTFLLKAVTERRNQWAHAPQRKLSDADKNAAFQDIKLLMNDPELLISKEVQDCELAINKVKAADVLILEENQLRLMEEYRRIKECETSNEEMKALIKSIKSLLSKSMSIFTLLLFVLALPWRTAPRLLYWCLVTVFLIFSRVGDKSGMVSDEGCSFAMIKSPISHFQFQQFDFSSYLAYKREGFVGRQWFFMELDNIFETDREAAGVLITGEPGYGKSALMSQLICSPYSSVLIHQNIIGYHLCEYSEKGKRDGARFVRNLVDQIAARLPGYSEYVIANEHLRIKLQDTLCQQDPTECFFSSILGPLRKLNPPLGGLRYIVIDALDECFESDKTSEIIEMLSSKIPHVPKWLKVILTSRNLTQVTEELPQAVRKMPLYANDNRNEKDIRLYVSRFISQNSFFVDCLKTAMNFNSRKYDMKIFLDKVITRAEGNFLFVKMTLQNINDTDGAIDSNFLPTSLFDLYNIFFKRQFGKGNFEPFRSLFEVLLFVGSPVQLNDVEELLKGEYEARDVAQLINQVSCFLRFGLDGTVRIYHQSFAEWLVNQSNVIHINKTRAHQNIANFLLHQIRKKDKKVTLGEVIELFMHMLAGNALEIQENAIDFLQITELREPGTNQSILHHLAVKPKLFQPVLEFVLPKFKTVDILDARKKTPAFYAAASEDFVDNLRIFIDGGADVSSFLEGFEKLDSFMVVVRNTGIEEFSLIHAAVAKGHKDVVELLLKSNVNFYKSNKNYPTPLHLAAGKGNLEVLRLFYVYGAKFDVITLHHAAAENHLDVVEFLLATVGVRDSCLQCTCKSEHLYTFSVEDVHLHFCETALYAAVSRRHMDIVKMLLSFGNESLECKHHSGKTVLMDAVERNDIEMVDLLLENGANVTTQCGRKMSKKSKNQMCSLLFEYKQDLLYTLNCIEDSCRCGNIAIHISAKYGFLKMAKKLSSKPIELITVENCGKESALAVAISRGHAHFIRYMKEIYENTALDSVIVDEAFWRFSYNEVKHILNYPVNEIYERRWKFLLRSVSWDPNFYYTLNKFPPLHYCPEFYEDENLSLVKCLHTVSKNRLAIMRLLVESFKKKSFILNRKDDKGMTVLHHAVKNGFDDAVKYLVEAGADTQITNGDSQTLLTLALESHFLHCPRNLTTSYSCYWTNDKQFGSCNTSAFDEITKYLIWSERSNFSKCDARSASLLDIIIKKQMPLSLYELLKAGVDMNCQEDKSAFRPFLKSLRLQRRQLSEVFKLFEVDITLECGVSFIASELHLISYFSPDLIGDFFQLSLNKRRSPLHRLIDNHPDGVGIFDKCHDDRGWLPIHIAAEGGNLAAIKWFKKIGINTQQKTRGNGATALDLSILKLENLSEAELFTPSESSQYSGSRKEVFEELLRALFATAPEYRTEFLCKSSLLTSQTLNLAAHIGLAVLRYVHKIALETFPDLPLHCPDEQRTNTVDLVLLYRVINSIVNRI